MVLSYYIDEKYCTSRTQTFFRWRYGRPLPSVPPPILCYALTLLSLKSGPEVNASAPVGAGDPRGDLSRQRWPPAEPPPAGGDRGAPCGHSIPPAPGRR